MMMMMMVMMMIMLMVIQWGCDWSLSARCVVSRFSTRLEIRWNLCLILTRRLSVSVEELTSTSLLYVILRCLSLLLHTCLTLALWNSAPAAIKVPNSHSGDCCGACRRYVGSTSAVGGEGKFSQDIKVSNQSINHLLWRPPSDVQGHLTIK